MPAVDAVKVQPQLAGAFALVAAIDKKAETAGLTEAQRVIVRERSVHNVEQAILRGEVVKVQLREQITEAKVEEVRADKRDLDR